MGRGESSVPPQWSPPAAAAATDPPPPLRGIRCPRVCPQLSRCASRYRASTVGMLQPSRGVHVPVALAVNWAVSSHPPGAAQGRRCDGRARQPCLPQPRTLCGTMADVEARLAHRATSHRCTTDVQMKQGGTAAAAGCLLCFHVDAPKRRWLTGREPLAFCYSRLFACLVLTK